jgi:hypothetical protein
MRKSILALIFVSVFALSVAFVGCAKKPAKPAEDKKVEAPADKKTDEKKPEAEEAKPNLKAGTSKDKGC